MSEKEAKKRESVMFQKNTILINENDKLRGQLGQAKRIIKEFVAWANWQGANCPNFKDIQSEAEQFLKGE